MSKIILFKFIADSILNGWVNVENWAKNNNLSNDQAFLIIKKRELEIAKISGSCFVIEAEINSALVLVLEESKTSQKNKKSKLKFAAAKKVIAENYLKIIMGEDVYESFDDIELLELAIRECLKKLKVTIPSN